LFARYLPRRIDGITFKLGAAYHQKLYTWVPPSEALEPLLQGIELLYDDEVQYAELAERARRVGQSGHQLKINAQRLMQALESLIARRAGNKDEGATVRKWHKQDFDDRSQ